MATTKDYRDYILEKLNFLDNIKYKPMMGEYLLYYNNTLIGEICDNRFLIKIVDTNKKYKLKEQIPYEGAKKMYLIDTEDKELIKEIIINTFNGLRK